MIQYRHYNSGLYDPETRYGVALYRHSTRWTLDVYFGSHVFVWFKDKGYNKWEKVDLTTNDWVYPKDELQ